MKEIWKDIQGWEGYYQASNRGRIRSTERTLWNGLAFYKKKGIVLKPGVSSNGYLIVCLQRKGLSQPKTVHRLIAQTFILNPENKPMTNHINGIKADNGVENLEWATSQENLNHALRTGLRIPVRGEKIGRSKLTEDQVIEIRRKYIPHKYHSGILAKEYNVSMNTIRSVILKKTWTHI